MHIMASVIVSGRGVIMNIASSQSSLNFGDRGSVRRRTTAHFIWVMQTIVDYLALGNLLHVLAAVVSVLHLAMIVVLAIALALVRWAVALPTGVVIANTHWCFAFVSAVFAVVTHLVPLLLVSS
jgi:apolipoprotein N-acyltransferase